MCCGNQLLCGLGNQGAVWCSSMPAIVTHDMCVSWHWRCQTMCTVLMWALVPCLCMVGKWYMNITNCACSEGTTCAYLMCILWCSKYLQIVPPGNINVPIILEFSPMSLESIKYVLEGNCVRRGGGLYLFMYLKVWACFWNCFFVLHWPWFFPALRGV